jgi:predicted MFS family arabinose efflux permease
MAARPGPPASRWLPIAGFALLASANQMLWLNFTPVTTGAAARLGVSQTDIGWLSEVFPLVYVVLALPAGRALDRWFRPTLALGAALTAAGALVRLGGGGSYTFLLAGQLLVAVAQPAVLNALTGIATRYLAEPQRPAGIAMCSAGTFLGFIEAFVLGGALGAGRLDLVLMVSAAYSLAAAGVLAASLGRPLHPPQAMGVGASAGAMRELWCDRVLRNLAAMVFLGFGVFIALATWVEALLKPAGVSASGTDSILVAMVVAGVAGCAAIPPLVASRRLQPQAIGVSAVAMAVGCGLMAARPGLGTAAGALVVIGLLVLPDLPVVLELAERRAGSAGGTATAFLWLSGNAGGIVVALVVQALQGDPAAAFSVLALVGVIALGLAGLLGRQLRPAPVRMAVEPAGSWRGGAPPGPGPSPGSQGTIRGGPPG